MKIHNKFEHFCYKIKHTKSRKLLLGRYVITSSFNYISMLDRIFSNVQGKLVNRKTHIISPDINH